MSVEILSLPQTVLLQYGDEWHRAEQRDKSFTSGGVKVSFHPDTQQGLSVRLRASTPISYIKLRWDLTLQPGCRLQGDAFERAYGDLEWHGLNPDRWMMWYLLIHDLSSTTGWGVMVQPAALAFWQTDAHGITLWLDVRCGGSPVELGERELEVCTIIRACSTAGESAFAFAKRFCRMLSPSPLLPSHPVYGANTWLYTYGYHYSSMSRDSVLEDSRRYAELAGSEPNRPVMVIDDGWGESCAIYGNAAGGPWEKGNSRFPDMDTLADDIRMNGCRPGIWVRLLETYQTGLPNELFLKRPGAQRILDPSHPESLHLICQEVSRLSQRGFQILKHDFSTSDIFGNFGLTMTYRFTDPGWRFHDVSHTTAEIVRELYRRIKQAAGSMMIIGCNCIGHLGAGLMELNRIGDDTSSYVWDRTRKYGINSLAFRLCQHNSFFAVDADCVGHRDEYISWDYSRQWLDLLARSGTPLLVSMDPRCMTNQQKRDITAAFQRAARQTDILEPVDWLDTTCPEVWISNGQLQHYNWALPTGTLNFGALTQFELV